MLNRIAVVLGVVLFVAGCRTVEPPPPPDAPRVSSFTASKTRIASGEAVTLSFSTSNATKVEVVDDEGRAVELTGTAAEGSGVVMPTRSSFYVLRATGAGGRDTAFVQIAVNEPLRDLFLIAVPTVINSGQQAQLLWGAPGASSATLKTGSSAPQPLTGTTGTVTVSPSTTEQYTLTAQGAAGTPPLTALAQIEVRPVLETATFEAPTGVKVGEVLRFTWKTAGAERISLSERTFGQVTTVTDAAAVATGTYDYTLPATLPNGIAVSDGLPLSFTLTASGGGSTVSRTFAAVVADLPSIDLFDAPEYATTGSTFTVSWKTTNATKVSIVSGGLTLFTTLPTEEARAASGQVRLPSPSAQNQTQYELVATNAFGGTARRIFSVQPVGVPTVATFTLTPSTIGALGDPVTARWTTTNAARILLRLEDGPTLTVIETPSRLNSGNTSLTLATGARITLEAVNAAGDIASLTRAVTFNGPSASVTPTLAVRGTPSTLAWTLQTASVTEVVGLPDQQADAGVVAPPQPGSSNFIDLTTVASAEELTFLDPASGTVSFAAPANFRFPLFGKLHSSFTVGVDGVLDFGTTLPTGPNADLRAGNAPQSVIAPFWDDLTLGTTSKVLTAVQFAASGERILIVQWNALQLAADTNSSVTFEVQLYETGQISFVYSTLTCAVDSATVGLAFKNSGIVQQYTFNSANPAPVSGLELVFFAGRPADGSFAFNAQQARRFEFFGRTTNSLVPISLSQRVFGVGDVEVSEAMPLPEATVASTGQWIELRNNQSMAIDFEGLVIDSLASTDGGYVIPADTVVPAGGYLVLGQSTDTTDTGGAPVSQVLTDVGPLAIPDNVRVSLMNTQLSSLSWDAGTPATSIQPKESVLLATGVSLNCTRTRTFGAAGALGTPGAANETCAPYLVTPISGAFRFGPAGSEILSTIDSDSGYGKVTLPVPFRYFGTSYTSFDLSTDGFIAFGVTLASSHLSNNTAVAVTAPNGVVAPFWDDLERKPTGRQAMWREIDRTIVSFESFEPWDELDSVLHFQVHLIDSGVIEFHYGPISTTSTVQSEINRITGSSATLWIEKVDGTLAVPWGVNRTGAVTPNSGLRFTPTSP